MRAWRLHELGEPLEVLRLEDRPPLRTPSTADSSHGDAADRVVVEVTACGLNFSDVLLCRGEYQERPSLPFTPGTEIAGVVLDAPHGHDLEPGSRVVARPDLPTGGLAEQAGCRADRVFPIPDSLDDTTAAALHVTYQTGWFGLHRLGRLRPGETLLVHAGAGGVGSAAIQLGVAADARVVATAGGAEQVAQCRSLGAEEAIDYRSQDFVGVVKDLTSGRGADVIYDSVGGETFDASRRCVAFEGRIIVVGFASGRFAVAPTNHIFVKNYGVLGLHWPLYEQQRPDLVRRCHDDLMRLRAAGHIRPVVSSVRPLPEAARALDDLAHRRTTGKVVIRT